MPNYQAYQITKHHLSPIIDRRLEYTTAFNYKTQLGHVFTLFQKMQQKVNVAFKNRKTLPPVSIEYSTDRNPRRDFVISKQKHTVPRRNTCNAALVTTNCTKLPSQVTMRNNSSIGNGCYNSHIIRNPIL